MSLERKEIFEFGEFRLDVNEHTIERIDRARNGTLTEKAFQTLVLLVRRRGHLVSKDELIRYVWPDTIVEDNNLEKCVHQLRQFLGETSDGSKYIETVRKHGYRFVGKVQAVQVSGSWLPETFRINDEQSEPAAPIDDQLTEPEAEAEKIVGTERAGVEIVPNLLRNELAPSVVNSEVSSTRTEAIELPRISKRRKGLLRGSKILLLGLGGGFFFLILLKALLIFGAMRSQYESSLTSGTANSMHDMMGDLLVMVLIPVGFGWFTGIGLFLFGIGRIVYALFEKENSRIKSLTVERVLAAVICLLLLSIAIPNLMFSYREANRVRQINRDQEKRGTNNEEAYRFYLLAMNLSEERGVQNVLKSLEYLDRAVALDPNYAPAWAAKANTHRDIATFAGTDQHEQYQRSMDSIAKARAIDPNLSEVYSALCHNKNRYEYDAAGAETACKRALELDANSPVAHKTYANFLYSRGRFDEAIVEIKTAMDLQPVSYRNQQMYALTLYYARRYDEAEEQFKRLVELNPNHSHIHSRLIMVLEEQGNESEAFEYLFKMLTIQKTDNEKLERFKTAYRTSGWRGVVIERIKTAEATADPGHFQLACLYAKIGDKDKALEYLEKAYQERSFLIAVLQVEPQLDSLRKDPRFADLIRRVEGK